MNNAFPIVIFLISLMLMIITADSITRLKIRECVRFTWFSFEGIICMMIIFVELIFVMWSIMNMIISFS